MILSTLQQKLKTFYASGDIKQALELLQQYLLADSEQQLDFLQISERYNTLEDERRADIIDYPNYKIQRNKIGRAFLHIVQVLQEKDIGASVGSKHQTIDNNILVITRKNLEEVAIFYKNLRFTNVKAQQDLEVSSISKYDVVIFDNRELPATPSHDKVSSDTKQRILLMESVIKQTPKFIIHYGEYLYWINGYRDRVQAANSKFSLYARTKEVIEFINTYRV